VCKIPGPWRAALLVVGLALGRADVLHAQRATLEPSRAFGGAEVIHESWSIADGLPVNSINHLIQSKDGYIWAATFDGLVRFDGVKFTVFNSANSALPSNRIVRLEEGLNGDLWVFTEQGHLVRRRNGRFISMLQSRCQAEQYRSLVFTARGRTLAATCTAIVLVSGDSAAPLANGLIRDSIAGLALDRTGTILVGLKSRGLLRLREQNGGQLTLVESPRDSVLAGRTMFALFAMPDGQLFVSSQTGLWSDRGGWHQIPNPVGQRLAPVMSMHSDPQGRGTLLYGHRRQLTLIPLERDAGFVAFTDGITLTPIDSGDAFFHDPPVWLADRSVWFGSRATLSRDGISVFSLGAIANPPKPGLNEASAVMTGLTDSEGSIWLGTYANGLHRLKPTVVRTFSTAEGLRTANAYGIYTDTSGDIWVGGQANGFSRINPASGRIEGFGSRASPPYAVRTFLEDRSGTLWIGSGDYPVGLYRCDAVPTLRCEMVPSTEKIVREVSALHEDAAGRIWVGAYGGLFRVEGGILRRVEDTPGAPKAPVRAFARTRDGAIWMATNGGGIARWANGTFRSITTADGLPSDLVRALHVDDAGMLWIGTEGRGLARLDPGKFSGAAGAGPIGVLTTRQGLYDDGIHEILADDSDRLWMSTNRGIFWLSRREASAFLDGRISRVHSTGYTERDGMRNREANGGMQPSGTKSRDGRLWFTTQDGVAVVDPSKIVSDTLPPPLVIEQVVTADSTIVNTGAPIRLSPSQRDIRVEFTALTYLEPRNVRFRYQLEGYNEDWVDNDTRRTAFFTKLPPGTYRFRVQAANPGRDWIDSGDALDIVVDPLFFETVWFRALAGVAFIALIIYAVQRRSQDARRRARELEYVVAERTVALRDREQQLETQNHRLLAQAEELQVLDSARNRFFANVSHELRTPLTLMIAPLDRLREQQQVDREGQRWLDLAQRNARRLLELVNQMLDVARLEAGAMRLTPRELDLSALARMAAESFRLTAERKSIRLVADVPAECRVTLDSDAVDKIVGNLLSNAVKFTPPGGFVSLELRTQPRAVVIGVANTGPAIPPEKLSLLFERFYQVDESRTTVQPGTGIGLSLVKELVELQGGTVTATSDAGSTLFSVTLPVPERFADEATSGAALFTTGPVLVDASAMRDDRDVDVPTLLVVDDSEDMRGFVAAHFASQYRVLQAPDGTAALELARSQLPDVIVSDVMMPGLDGRELVKALRSSPETDYLAIILLTAQAENELRIAGLEGGADDYLGKPFEMRELDVRVRNLIAARRRLQLRYGASSPPNGSDVERLADPVFVPTNGDPALDSEDQAYRDRVLAAIRARMGDADFGVTELANDMAQDRSHLFRRVKQVTGFSPSDLLRRLRVEEGARLLLASSGSVADVAFSVGFRSVSHFFRCFNERYGVTPSEYRASGSRLDAPDT
jgi:signal transduction histidine kinase/ligand-binding sensor domain-containing protein/CheY-like chemotaxis protein/AraC-like DNA-binding protein